MPTHIREEIEAKIKAGDYKAAFYLLTLLIGEEPSSSAYFYANKIFNSIGKELKFQPIKIAILRSFTIEQIIPYLRVICFLKKFEPEIYIGGYNLIDQEILNHSSDLYKFNPDFLIIAARAEERCPRLVTDFLSLSRDEILREIESNLSQTEKLVQEFRANSAAKVILHNYEIPEFLSYGIFDVHSESSQKHTFISLNDGLQTIAKKFSSVFILDYEHLTSRYGKQDWFNEKLWYTARAPIAKEGLEALAKEYVKFLIATEGRTKKCVVVDLDNTLWGGIVGEIGWNEIQIGQTYPGNAYLDFQRELLKLYQKGIVLAVNSKNNEADIMEVFEKRSEMVLKKNHFACMKINWENKVKNMIEIARELNLGIDSFVYLDDNPAERELVRQQCPDVLTVELPEHPESYARTLKSLPDFEKLSFTEEDFSRGRLYYEDLQRKQEKQQSTSMESFFRSLNMEATICKNEKSAISRLTDLTQKTNQFNLTTIRYSREDISKILNAKNSRIYSLRVSDKFGDLGLVGEIIIRESKDTWEIDTFLLSCRAMGRDIESAFLAYVVGEAKKEKIKWIIGKYIPTKKNVPSAQVYKQLHFQKIVEENGISTWKFDVGSNEIKQPEWIRITEKKEN